MAPTGELPHQILEHLPGTGLMMFCQFMSGTFGNVAAGTHGLPAYEATFRTIAQHYRPDSQGALGSFGELWAGTGRAQPGLGRVLCDFLESKDTNMSIRGKSIFTTLAIMLIATAPAWSQSLLKRLDPDKDGTVDLAEAKSAASKLFDKLDRDHDGTLDKRELRGRVNAKDFAAADPDSDGTLDKNEFLALVEKRFNAANPDNDGTIDAKELKSAAGRSLARLLN
jgi:Ca2+-binding EF-hand superfamily protein